MVPLHISLEQQDEPRTLSSFIFQMQTEFEQKTYNCKSNEKNTKKIAISTTRTRTRTVKNAKKRFEILKSTVHSTLPISVLKEVG